MPDLYLNQWAELSFAPAKSASANPASPPSPAPLEESDAVAGAEALIGQLQPLLQGLLDTQAQIVEALDREEEQQRRETIHARAPIDLALRVRQLLDQKPLILDYETTGVRRLKYAYHRYQDKKPHQAHQVLGLAVMDSQGNILFQSRLNPQRDISPGAIDTHGVTAGQVAGLPTWQQIAPLLEAYLRDETVIAFNAGFDASFTPDWNITWICAKDLADEAFGRHAWPDTEAWQYSASLENRLRQCGLQPGPVHTPAGDCLSVLRLLRYLAGYTQTI